MRSCLLAHWEIRSSQCKDLCNSVVGDGVRQAKLPHIDVKNHKGDSTLNFHGYPTVRTPWSSFVPQEAANTVVEMTGQPHWRWTRVVVTRLCILWRFSERARQRDRLCNLVSRPQALVQERIDHSLVTTWNVSVKHVVLDIEHSSIRKPKRGLPRSSRHPSP